MATKTPIVESYESLIRYLEAERQRIQMDRRPAPIGQLTDAQWLTDRLKNHLMNPARVTGDATQPVDSL